MRIKRQREIILLVITAIVLAAAGIYFFQSHNQNLTEGPAGTIAASETDPAVWGKFYPRHYQSYMENFNNTSQPSHFLTAPYMKTIYAGTGFAAEYNEPRGHVYTLEDIRKIDPARRKAGASCNTCKSPEVIELMEKYGDKYYFMPFEEVNVQLKYSISCLDCHDPATMELKITRPALREALQRQGRDLSKISHQEMRTLVCAQCHVTYYFAPGTKRITFPWDQGVKADNILAYFDEMKFSESNHPLAGTALAKVRHAEYETFLGSTHESAGVACADCHMPYKKVGNVKISSHNWTSPTNNLEESCTACHRNGTEWLKQRVDAIQSQTKELQDIAGADVVQAISELQITRNTTGADSALLQQAQAMHRKAQWYLDYVMVTNGYGFHNPTETMSNLGKAIDYAHQSMALARQARQNR